MRLDPTGIPGRVRPMDGPNLPGVEPCPYCGSEALWFIVPDARSAEMVPSHRGIMCPDTHGTCRVRPWLSYGTGEWTAEHGNTVVFHDEELAEMWNMRAAA